MEVENKRQTIQGSCIGKMNPHSNWLGKPEVKFHEFLQPVGLKAWSFKGQWAWLRESWRHWGCSWKKAGKQPKDI